MQILRIGNINIFFQH